jgi:hypothetical protein
MKRIEYKQQDETPLVNSLIVILLDRMPEAFKWPTVALEWKNI